jgi:hypothetical protein
MKAPHIRPMMMPSKVCCPKPRIANNNTQSSVSSEAPHKPTTIASKECCPRPHINQQQYPAKCCPSGYINQQQYPVRCVTRGPTSDQQQHLVKGLARGPTYINNNTTQYVFYPRPYNRPPHMRIICLYRPIDVPPNMKQASITQRDRANQFDNDWCVLVYPRRRFLDY